jgi:hypothetical protein
MGRGAIGSANTGICDENAVKNSFHFVQDYKRKVADYRASVDSRLQETVLFLSKPENVRSW